MKKTPEKIVLASGNKKKVAELQILLESLNMEVIPQTVLGITDAEETGLSFVENAIIKARHAAQCSGLPAIADDSGLEVDALLGRPGIYSARFAGEPPDDANNNLRLLQELSNVPDDKRSARFQCVLVYLRHAEDPTPLICQGSWEGKILREPTGHQGFGYDPLFWVPTHYCSAAQLLPEEKSKISHRGVAMKKLLLELKHHHD